MRTWSGMALAGAVVGAAGGAHAEMLPHYAGAVHVHTKASGDAKGTFENVAASAAGVHLDYVIVTDHNTLKPLTDVGHRYYTVGRDQQRQVLILIGGERTTVKGHVLALNMPQDPEGRFAGKNNRPQQEILDGIRNALGYSAPPGLPFVAHPFAPSWEWGDWNAHGYQGMEVINLAALFDRKKSGFLGRSHLSQPETLPGPSAQRLLPDMTDSLLKQLSDDMVRPERAKWDSLLAAGRQVVGIAAADAHFAYGHMLDTVQTYAVTLEPLNKNVEHDRDQIFSAYANGRLYMVFHRASPSQRTRDFDFQGTNGRETRVMGQPLLLRSGEAAELTVTAPANSHTLIRILRHGEEVASFEKIRKSQEGTGPETGAVLRWATRTPGAYRVEVFHSTRSRPLLASAGGNSPTVEHALLKQRGNLRPWIFSNPIYVRSEETTPVVVESRGPRSTR